jgi:SAM-dependent methyltransferase
VFYGEPLAKIHQESFSGHWSMAAPALLDTFSENSLSGGHLVDLGCGDGGWLRALTDAGYEATGVEISSAFLALARQTAPKAHHLQASVHKANLPPCDAVTALGEVLGYLPDGLNGPRPDLGQTFARVYEALRPGGLFVFDLLVAGEPMQYRHWREGQGWSLLVDVSEDTAAGLLKREIIIFSQEADGRYVRTAECHWLQVPKPEVVVEMLSRQGFSVETSTAYGQMPLLPRRSAFWAKKPSA